MTLTKKKTLTIILILTLALTMVPQTVFAGTASGFDDRPVVKTVTTGQTSVKISWKRVSGADGYCIYRALDGGKFKLIKTIKNGSTLTYSNTGLQANTEYFYRIKAYKVRDGKKIYSPYSWSKQGNAGIPQELRGFSAYSSDGENIYTHWHYDKWAEGALIYRSNSKSGPYKQIGQTRMTVDEGFWYTDATVTPGETYYYKARPYITYNGKVIKGKYTKASGQAALRENPAADVEILPGADGRELRLKVTMKEFGYDTDFFIAREEGNELGTVEFDQYWIDGNATESRYTSLTVTGLSHDGKTWQREGKLTAKPGETVYLKTAVSPADDELHIGGENRTELHIYCHYDGKYSVVGIEG